MILLDYLFYSIYMGTEKTYGEGSITVTCNLISFLMCLLFISILLVLRIYGIDLCEIFPVMGNGVFIMGLYLLLFGLLFLFYTKNDRYKKVIDRFFY